MDEQVWGLSVSLDSLDAGLRAARLTWALLLVAAATLLVAGATLVVAIVALSN